MSTPDDDDPMGHKRTLIFATFEPQPDRSTEPVPPPPLTAAATLLRSIRHYFAPKPSAREVAILEVLSALEIECARHRGRVRHLGRCLEHARGRR